MLASDADVAVSGSGGATLTGLDLTAVGRDPHVVVLFGACGDQSRRKLLPGLTHLALSALTPDVQVVATSLEAMDED